MGTTEESIVYQLLNTIRAAELNNDEVVTERRVRSLMRIQRPSLISKFSNKGETIQDVCFQRLDDIQLTDNNNEYIAELPALVYLPNNFGVRITTKEFANITLVNNEDYELSKRNPINKHKPKATIIDQVLKIYLNGTNPSNLDGGSRANQVNQSIIANKAIQISAVLDNPENGLNYDWTKTEYPLNPEAISELKNNILRRDFQLVLQTKSDQVPNSKNDTLRYHDQDDVQR